MIPGGRCAWLLLAALSLPAHADRAVVAVASNFAEVMEVLAAEFSVQSGHELGFTTGSTGTLYAQIMHGAPFDVLLAADTERPQRLIDGGLAVPTSKLTYAIGRLTLWSTTPGLAVDRETLTTGHFRKLAIANPAVAPYGTAAMEVLQRLGLEGALRARLVFGENIGQVHALVATGNAELGLVALSFVRSPRNRIAGSAWDVPEDWYTPIRQDGVILTRAVTNQAAVSFMVYLTSPGGRTTIERFGYRTDKSPDSERGPGALSAAIRCSAERVEQDPQGLATK